jgi:uncharacterized protein (DUF885 family)
MMGAVLLALAAALAAPEAGPTAAPAPGPSAMRDLAHGYFLWYHEQFPVLASDAGLHDGDSRLTDFGADARAAREKHVSSLLRRLEALPAASWSPDDRVDLALLQAHMRRVLFDESVLRRWSRDPGLYVDECANGIFSLLKREYAPRAERARAAAARLRRMPALLATARQNLSEGVPLLASLATQAIDGIGPLFLDSLEPLRSEVQGSELQEFTAARDEALQALRDFRAWLRTAQRSMKAPLAIGREAYEELLRDIHLLPIGPEDLARLGEVELSRARALEAMLPDPALADTLPAQTGPGGVTGAREYLSRYEAQTSVLIDHIQARDLLTVPAWIGPFQIEPLPAAFRPTSPGGFMNPPGVFDTDPSGFYFLPPYDPNSRNFYVRAALSNPLPILGHEGIPGHFLQLSIANHNPNEIRRLSQDGVFIEGWALYTEELLLRTGLYDGPSQKEAGEAGKAQVLRLMRYRAARIPVDVRLATGEWTFGQAVEYFMKEGGLDREAATGEAAGAAVNPGQKMTYITGKHQIQRLLGLYREKRGRAFRLRDFHDELLALGSMPLCLAEWLMLGNEGACHPAAAPA